MPITSRLTRKLNETFGQEAADDLVDWMTGIDAQRGELRELNELSTSRLEARMGSLEARLEARMDAGFAKVDLEFATVRGEMATGFAKVDLEFAAVRGEMATGFAKLEAKIEKTAGEVMKWSFLFWIGSTVAMVGAVVTLAQYGR